jgi:hypothetical protein
MVPLYAARIEDLGPGDYIRVQGTACGHDELLMSDQLRIKGVSLPPYTPVLDLEPLVRCRKCDAKGKAVVSVRWGDPPCDFRAHCQYREDFGILARMDESTFIAVFCGLTVLYACAWVAIEKLIQGPHL